VVRGHAATDVSALLESKLSTARVLPRRGALQPTATWLTCLPGEARSEYLWLGTRQSGAANPHAGHRVTQPSSSLLGMRTRG
jgi:hypothetical protein